MEMLFIMTDIDEKMFIYWALVINKPINLIRICVISKWRMYLMLSFIKSVYLR